MCKIVVYTAFAKGRGNLSPVPAVWRNKARFVAFLEQPRSVPGWEIRSMNKRFSEPTRNEKIHKALSHIYFPEAEYSLWIDGSVTIKSEIPVDRWIAEHLRQGDIAAFKHRLRNCLYDEGFISLELGCDSDALIKRQMQRYSDEGYPQNIGLIESMVLLRRHTPKVKCLNEAWYKEIKHGSHLDQLSLNYITHKLDVKVCHLPGTISSNPHFEWNILSRLGKPAAKRKKVLLSSLNSAKAKQKTQLMSETKSNISMVYLYYDNPQMLKQQIECWNTYTSEFKTLPEVFLIDDGSPRTFAADIVQTGGCQIPIKVFRIQEDIPWNFTGARNLGCTHAHGWIYVSDIDTLLFAKDAKKLFEGDILDKNAFYMPKRVWLPDFDEADPGIVNLFFHKEKFLEIGGYDEDYSGHYGREETDFHNRLKRVAKKVYREDVLIHVMPDSLMVDARTISDRPRDKTRNAEVYAHKEAAGFIKPVNPLRFSWERVF